MQLTILGGGGLRTPLFINGLAHSPEGQLFDKVVLYDVDEERIAILGALSRYIVETADHPFELAFSADIREALSHTDFVFAAIRVGQDEARIVDEMVPMRYGVMGQETTGPGGFSMALRTIPVMRDYAKALKKYAPDAWLLNFTNPAGIITQALADIDIKSVGICDSPSDMKRRLARFLQVELSHVDIEYFGLNHLGWISGVRVDGVNRLPDILDRFEELGAQDAEFACFSPQLVRQLGCLPNEYLYYYYSAQDIVKRVSGSDATRGKQIQDLNRRLFQRLRELIPQHRYQEALGEYERMMNERSQSYMQREIRGTADPRDDLKQSSAFSGGYEEVALAMIASLIHDRSQSLVLDVSNRGCIPFLREDDVVEVSTTVSASGIHRLPISSVPAPCEELMVRVKDYERQTIEAALTGDREKAISALSVHPLVGSYEIAERIMNDYLKEQFQYLSQFH